MSLTAKPVPPAKRKCQHFLEYPDIKRWHENVSRGSAITADVYLRRFGSFCQDNGTTPKALLQLTEIELYNLLLDLNSAMGKEGHDGMKAQNAIQA
jgi:hypothetical protein